MPFSLFDAEYVVRYLIVSTILKVNVLTPTELKKAQEIYDSAPVDMIKKFTDLYSNDKHTCSISQENIQQVKRILATI